MGRDTPLFRRETLEIVKRFMEKGLSRHKSHTKTKLGQESISWLTYVAYREKLRIKARDDSVENSCAGQ